MPEWEQQLREAMEHFSAGRIEAAEKLGRRLLAEQPGQPAVRQLLARIRETMGRLAAQQQAWPQAKIALQEALELAPCWSAAWNNLSNVQRRLGDLHAAELSLLRAFTYTPTDPDYLINLGHLYSSTSQTLQAEQCYRQALTMQPENNTVLRALGELCERQGRWSDAVEIWQQWHAAEPNNADPLIRLGILHKEAERHHEAEQAWSQAIQVRPQDLAGYGNLGQLYAERGDWQQAEQTYQAGLKQSSSPSLQILAATCLPVIAENESQLASVRTRVLSNLQELVERGVKVDTARERMPTLFYLAYHGENDRPFHETMAKLSTTHRLGKQAMKKHARSSRLRIGILSHFLREHTIGRLNVGLFERLSRKKFEVVAIPCQPMRDPLAERMVKAADQTAMLPGDVSSAIETLKSLQLDMLYYADIGMMPISYTLAFNRVAPVQLATWGHPVTTGLPTMDYFVSSQALETPASDDFYTESLIRLPRLGVYYDPPEPRQRSVDRGEFGATEREHVYVCPQTLFKFHPRFDAVLAGILRADPQGVLLLLEGRFPQWQSRLLARWQQVMPDVLPRIRFLPKLPRERFLDLLSIADVMLDPPVFGGGNTSYEGLGLGVPIVTWPDPFLRSRLTAAMYAQMDITGLTVSSSEEYVKTAVEVACNSERRLYFADKILRAKRAIFHDAAAITALEEALVRCWEE